MSGPAVSVIIPTFNRRAMVGEAIASVMAQTERDFELIVVDDGSDDGTWDELQTIADACVANRGTIRVERIVNSGPAAARNRGIAMARGQYIAFLDSDDLWASRKLARQLELMRTLGCAICQTQEIWIRNGRRVNPGTRHQKRSGDIFSESLRTCLISPSTVMIDTRLLRESGGFDERMQACEDYDLWLRLLVDHEPVLLDEALVTRRAGHGDQLSANTPALDRFRILSLAKLIASGRLSDERRSQALLVLAEKCVVYSNGLKRRGLITEVEFFAHLALQATDRSTTTLWTHEALISHIADLISLDHVSLNQSARGCVAA